jgi:hypothetical protein
MRPAAEARARGRQREVAGDKGQWALFCKGLDQLQLRLQNGGKGQFLSFPHFLFLKEREKKRGTGVQFDPLAASGWQGVGRYMFSGGVTIFTIVSTLVMLKADKGVVSGGYRLQVNRNSDCRGISLYRAISSSCNARD